MKLPLADLLIGRKLANREAENQKLGVFAGVPAMGLDGLGSAAYGPEAALTILAAAGAAGLRAVDPITWVILVLLAILYFSYRQTIAAYPSNGGSYTVAKENLGTNAGLLAAAALMVDYTLNVAVGISAGVGALTSAVPVLHQFTLGLCLGILALLTLANLRGTRESGLVWAIPTYTFVASLGFVLLWGVTKTATGPARPVIPPPHAVQAAGTVTLWLLLRAFASGCTAMTGVEAVSNGVSAFREPKVRHARATLTVIVVVLGGLLLGIAWIARSYGILAMDQTKPGYQSVLSQLVGAVYGRGWFYYVTIASVLAVLCLSANTSFVGFPRLCRQVAADGFLPSPFAVPGRRLVYSVGILFLAAGSGSLIAGFDGITDRLIPLFAVGAFLSFTLSQAGMAIHWRRALRADSNALGPSGVWYESRSANHARLVINGSGAVATGVALAIILLAKFAEGAWLTVIVIPGAVLLLKANRRYYDDIDRQVLQGSHRRVDLRDQLAPVAVVPIKRWDRVARKALEYAIRISPHVVGLHVTTLEGPGTDDPADALRRDWREFVETPAARAGLDPPRLELVRSPYRSVVAPLLRTIKDVNARLPGHPVLIVLPELVEPRWWGYVMHIHRERLLRARLLRYGGPAIAIVSVPWQLRPAEPEQGLQEEEPATGSAPATKRDWAGLLVRSPNADRRRAATRHSGN